MPRAVRFATLAALPILVALAEPPRPVQLPPGAYEDAERGFALVVPRGWKVADPKKVTVDRSVETEWTLAATLVSERDRSAPTVTINASERVWELTPDASGIAEIERWVHASWGQQASLELSTEIATVDGVPAFHTSILATVPDGRQVSMDQYVFSGARHSYGVVAALSGDRRKETAKAAQAVTQGFRLLERPR